MTKLSLTAQAVLDAANASATNAWSDATHQRFRTGVADALRAAVAHTQLYQGNDCLSNEVWTCDSDELLAIADELEAAA
jgi:hypothetical protein